MQRKKKVVSTLWSMLLLLAVFPGKSHAGEYDLAPVPQNLKLLRLNGSITAMREEKWILAADTVIYNTGASLQLDDRFRMVRSEEARFNDAGNILDLRTSTLTDEKKSRFRDSVRTFGYEKNRMISIVNRGDHRTIDSTELHYLRKGPLDYYRVFDNAGRVLYKITYAYKGGKVFTVRKKNAENFAISMIRFDYKEGRLAECRYFDDRFRLSEIRRFASKKDRDGNRNESYSVSDAAGIMKGGLTLTLDTAGNITEQSVVNADRTVSEYSSYKYDARGNRIAAKVFTPSQEGLLEYRYTYDANNNWTRKEVFTNDQLTSVIVRTYTYN